jgi:hypothetical protein
MQYQQYQQHRPVLALLRLLLLVRRHQTEPNRWNLIHHHRLQSKLILH